MINSCAIIWTTRSIVNELRAVDTIRSADAGFLLQEGREAWTFVPPKLKKTIAYCL